MVTTKQIVGIHAQMNEIIKRVGNDSLDPELVKRGLQTIIQKGDLPTEFGVLPPCWYVSPEQQLERVHRLNTEHGWGFAAADFPAVPSVKLSGTEVLLLAVYLYGNNKVSALQRTFDEHVAVIQQQLEGNDRSFWQWDELTSDPDHLRLHGTWGHKTGLRWVVYDYVANHDPKDGHTVEDLRNVGTPGLAASEVLSALMLFPEYGLSMDGDKTPYANLPGYEVLYQSDWSDCPYVLCWRGNRELDLSAHRADDRDYDWASPVVREC